MRMSDRADRHDADVQPQPLQDRRERRRSATSQSKNDALTRGQPGEDTSASTAMATSATVDRNATAVDRRARLRR